MSGGWEMVERESRAGASENVVPLGIGSVACYDCNSFPASVITWSCCDKDERVVH